MNIENQITELEIQLSHAIRTIEELSVIAAEQAQRLDRADKRIEMLMQRAAEAEAEATSGIALGNQPPPHW